MHGVEKVLEISSIEIFFIQSQGQDLSNSIDEFVFICNRKQRKLRLRITLRMRGNV